MIAKKIVSQNRYIHQRGSGLLYSASVSSQTWPCNFASPSTPFSPFMFETRMNTQNRMLSATSPIT